MRFKSPPLKVKTSKGCLTLTRIENPVQMLFTGGAIDWDTLPGNATLDYRRETNILVGIEAFVWRYKEGSGWPHTSSLRQ